MPKFLKNIQFFCRGGFSLIELMVAISIVAVLSAVGMVVYTNVMNQGRDSRRQSDLLVIQSALELYFADMGFYPYANWSNKGLDDKLSQAPPQAFTNAVGSQLATASRTYINSLPTDPKSGTQRYKYIANPETPEACDNSTSAKKCISYCLYAKLESPPAALPPLPSGCSSLVDYNYVIGPP